MLPQSLVSDFSIVQQNPENRVLTFSAELNIETGETLDVKIAPHLLGNVMRTNYDHVNSVLKNDPNSEQNYNQQQLEDLKLFHQLALARRKRRAVLGAKTFVFPKAELKITDTKDLNTLKFMIKEETPADILVSEMMVLAGELGATFCAKNEIPIPFRFQKPPGESSSSQPKMDQAVHISDPTKAPRIREQETEQKQSQQSTKSTRNELDYDLARTYQQILLSSQAEVGLTPSRHSALGLDIYTRATSPIRRYSDMIVHYQLNSFFKGERLPFSTERLLPIVERSFRSEQNIKELQRKSVLFWTRQFLNQPQNASSTFSGVVVNVNIPLNNSSGMFFVHIFIDSIAFIVRKRVIRSLSLGQRVSLVLKKVDAFDVEFDLLDDFVPEESEIPVVRTSGSLDSID